jgi:hypothetical protein
MYEIKKYSYDQAKRLGVIIKPSAKANYKIDVYDKNKEYLTSIGDKRYKDFPTYTQEKGIEFANERRRLYRIRHKNDSGIRGYYAKLILW